LKILKRKTGRHFWQGDKMSEELKGILKRRIRERKGRMVTSFGVKI